jgi:hypothetical protein
LKSKLAEGKAKIGLVLPETLIAEVRHLAVERKVQPSLMAEELLRVGLKRAQGKTPKAGTPELASSAT